MASDSFDAAVVVVAVGDEDEGAADGAGLLQGQHLVFAGFVEGVEEGGAAAGTELADALVEEVDVVGEVLGEVGLDVEAFDKGAVVAVEDLEKELDGGVLLELEALADGAGGVEHDADAQGQIGLLGEAEDGEGGAAVVEEAEVFALEAGDELTFLSVTVKMRFTSLTWTLMVVTGSSTCGVFGAGWPVGVGAWQGVER